VARRWHPGVGGGVDQREQVLDVRVDAAVGDEPHEVDPPPVEAA